MPTPVLPGGGLARLLRRHARLVGLLVTGCVAVGVVRWCPAPGGDLDNPQYDALVKAHSRLLAARQDSATQALGRADSAVARVVVRYRTLRDTLNVHDTTQVRVLVSASDALADSVETLQRRVHEYQRTVADVIADRDLQIASVAALSHVPRAGLSADALYDPIAHVPAAALTGTYRLTARVSALARVEQRFAPGQSPRVYVGARVVL